MSDFLYPKGNEDSAAAVGRIPKIAPDVPDSDLAIFLDGDITNFDDENVLDFNFFCEAYTYRDFIEDYMRTDRLVVSCESMKDELRRAKAVIAQQARWIVRLQDSLSRAQSIQRPRGEQTILELFQNQNKMP